MKKAKKALSLFLALIMLASVFSSLPTLANAASTIISAPTFSSPKDGNTVYLDAISSSLSIRWNKVTNAKNYTYHIKLLPKGVNQNNSENAPYDGLNLEGTTTGTSVTVAKSRLKIGQWLKIYVAANSKSGASANTVIFVYISSHFTVSFNANGGSVSPSNKSVTYGSTYGPLPIPERTGYTFDGWYTSSSGGSQKTSDSSVTITANQTLYAHWTASKISAPTFSFPKDGNTVYLDAISSSLSIGWSKVTNAKNYTYHIKLLPKGINRNNSENASYDGLNLEGTTTGTSISVAKSSLKVGQWLKIYVAANSQSGASANTVIFVYVSSCYTVSFNANSGVVSPSSKSVTYGSAYGTLPTPIRTGYTFDGWYTKASGGTKVTDKSDVTITANQTLYAHWTANKTYTISFNANGGSVSPSSKSVTYGSTYGPMPIPERTGYTFDGWYTSSSGGSQKTSDSNVTIRANQTLYAHWTAKTYTVSFDANGGSVSKKSISVKYGSTYGTLPTPECTGFTFDGWYTNASAGTKVTGKSKVTITANQTLYAHWTAKTYTVSFKCSSKGIKCSSIKVAFNQQYGELPIPERTGYKFAGWYTAKGEDGMLVTKETFFRNKENITLYGKWIQTSYSMSELYHMAKDAYEHADKCDTCREFVKITNYGAPLDGFYTFYNGLCQNYNSIYGSMLIDLYSWGSLVDSSSTEEVIGWSILQLESIAVNQSDPYKNLGANQRNVILYAQEIFSLLYGNEDSTIKNNCSKLNNMLFKVVY